MALFLKMARQNVAFLILEYPLPMSGRAALHPKP
jgi:hypothetical protein